MTRFDVAGVRIRSVSALVGLERTYMHTYLPTHQDRADGRVHNAAAGPSRTPRLPREGARSTSGEPSQPPARPSRLCLARRSSARSRRGYHGRLCVFTAIAARLLQRLRLREPRQSLDVENCGVVILCAAQKEGLQSDARSERVRLLRPLSPRARPRRDGRSEPSQATNSSRGGGGGTAADDRGRSRRASCGRVRRYTSALPREAQK